MANHLPSNFSSYFRTFCNDPSRVLADLPTPFFLVFKHGVLFENLRYVAEWGGRLSHQSIENTRSVCRASFGQAMSDKRELHPYGLIPVYCAAALLGAVIISIVIDRIMRCLDDRRRRTACGLMNASKVSKSTSSLRTVTPPVLNDYGSSTISQRTAS